MRQHQKYQTICDYTPTISHDMSVTHDIKRYEKPMQKLQALTFALFFNPPVFTNRWVFYAKNTGLQKRVKTFKNTL